MTDADLRPRSLGGGKAAQITPKVGSPPPVVAWSAHMPPTALSYTGTTVQSVQGSLRRAFQQSFPIVLKREHLPILRGMIAAAGEGFVPYQMLYDALDKFGEIEVRDQL